MSELLLPDPDSTATSWTPPGLRELLNWPLPGQNLIDRTLTRTMGLLARRSILSVSGLEHVRPEHDPFILAANHSSRSEALVLPTLLALHRHGKLVHFLGDWNFRLYPGLNFLYRRSRTITVSRKPVPIWPLDRLRPLYRDPEGPLRRARSYLERGRSVGIFPEGTVNTDDARLMSGHCGAAWLSLRTGAPIIPVGIVVTPRGNGRRSGIDISIGRPLDPKDENAPARSRAGVREWHATIMQSIAALCGKDWVPEEGAVQNATR